jgi:hypothetical protein
MHSDQPPFGKLSERSIGVRRADRTALATSTADRVVRQKPSVLSPQWDTRSTSRKPGRSSVQSAKVRMGMELLSRLPGLVVLKG